MGYGLAMRIFLLVLLGAFSSLALAADPPRHPTLHGKVVTGYQGWFAPTIEGTRSRWVHLGHAGKFEPGFTCIDLWPDTTGFAADERVATDFKHADGSVAYVFSSSNPKTVDRHFSWMKQYGIDGAFLQRFGVSVNSRSMSVHINKVMDNVRKSSDAHGRSWSVMYDLSGLRKGQIKSVVMEDWRRLVKELNIRKDRSYQHHGGRPVVTVWGIGFNDNRDYTLEECLELVKFLKSDPEVGGNTVMIGVPYYWRTLKNDTVTDPLLHQIVTEAHIVSPWAVGRYGKPEQMRDNRERVIVPDVAWAKERKLDYMPVIFPGFSWHNLQKNRGREAKLNQIPRLKGQFLWSQAAAVAQSGIDMVYIAMFDEIDEGTAIFKLSENPPVGESPFVPLEAVPADHYLWLSGQIGKMLRKEFPVTPEMPKR